MRTINDKPWEFCVSVNRKDWGEVFKVYFLNYDDAKHYVKKNLASQNPKLNERFPSETYKIIKRKEVTTRNSSHD